MEPRVNYCWYCGQKLMRVTNSKSKRVGKFAFVTRTNDLGQELVMHTVCADKYDCEQEQNNNYFQNADSR